MAIEIRKIAIRNFKNLKDVVIYPKKFNVLIGPNGSGKTNFLEFFKLLRKIYVERSPYPFLEWDGYENVVWNHQRSLPIEFEIETAEKLTLTELIRRYSWYREVKFEKDLEVEVYQRASASLWADRSEKLKILSEKIEIVVPKLNYVVSIEKDGENWKIRLNDKIYDIKLNFRSLHLEIAKVIEEGLKFYNHEYIMNIIEDFLLGSEIFTQLSEEAERFFMKELDEILDKLDIQPKKLVFNLSDGRTLERSISNLIDFALSRTIHFPILQIFKLTTLFSLNLTEIKYKRRIVPRDEPLNDRGDNALDILALVQLKENGLPERIEYVVEQYFNGRIYFRNANLYLYNIDRRTEYSKEHLPDGLLKLLVILTALEQNPSILLIDEIENSLHPELLEFLINTLKEECEGCVFVTTHSPVVLNLVEPDEIFIFKPKDDGSIEIKNVTEYKSKEELMKELEELGISLGEKVLYGFM